MREREREREECVWELVLLLLPVHVMTYMDERTVKAGKRLKTPYCCFEEDNQPSGSYFMASAGAVYNLGSGLWGGFLDNNTK